jgi:hydroxyethylthiazole kinase
MLTSILGAMCGANQDSMLDATAAGVCAMGISGEVAAERMEKYQAGTSSLKMYLIDTMSTMEEELYQSRARFDVI